MMRTPPCPAILRETFPAIAKGPAQEPCPGTLIPSCYHGYMPADKKDPQQTAAASRGLWGRFRTALQRTRHEISGPDQVQAPEEPGTTVTPPPPDERLADADFWQDLETRLIRADVGVGLASDLLQRTRRRHGQSAKRHAVLQTLHKEMLRVLAPCECPLTIDAAHRPFVVLAVGINGAGKTTTIGKLAWYWQQDGLQVAIAAADTFRAAAIEQLKLLAQRHNTPVIAQQQGADAAAVVFDAIKWAQAHNIDVLLADTAGRLATQSQLMTELSKVVRVIQKADSTAPHEVLLVLDAGIGQNTIQQVEQFKQAVGVTGLVITKLDGTAKGGIVLALANTFGLPIRFLGLGEKDDDLRPFAADAFVSALLGET